MRKLLIVLLSFSLPGLLLSGCGGKKSESTKENTISLVFGSEPNTIDPALNSAVDSAIYLSHSHEGLYKYADTGSMAFPGINNSKVVPGIAAGAPSKTVNADGTVTLVYTLRNGLKWSDGSAFTAEDIVYSWQRLVDPSTAADYSYMIDMIVNASRIMEGETDKSSLGVKAVNATTLEVSLTFDCPYFDEIMAFPATFPVKRSVIEKTGDQWTFNPSTYISNGPYRLKEWVHNSYLLYEKNPNYYASVTGPEFLRFVLMDDENAMLNGFRSGELDFIEQVPIDEIPTLLNSGELKVADYLGTYYISFNTKKAPFNDPNVRKAFALTIDRNYIVDQIIKTGQKPASGFVPAGMTDAQVGSDFRRTGGNYYSINDADYKANVAEAKQLLAKAGYPEGRGFPIVEYLYNTSDSHRAIAEAIQNMWRTNLGVNVTIGNQEWNVFLDTRKTGNFMFARDGWIGDYNDPIGFLDMFVSGGGNNNPQYENKEYDALIAKIKTTSVQADRMRLMHQAEDILVGRDMAVGPIYFYTQSYMINPRVKGAYYTPLGYFFFSGAGL
jgi:oligopeptide transport system substrate-binding protein